MEINLGSVLLWGFVATLILTGIMYTAQETNQSRMSIPFMLGAMLTAARKKAKLVGFGLHLVNGWVFALLYAVIFEAWGMAGWWAGLLLGLTHAFVVLTVGMEMLPAVHPRMADERQGPTPTRWLQPPGFFARNYGRATPLWALLAHGVYGTILGTFYEPTTAAVALLL